jgi:hypothetical protein
VTQAAAQSGRDLYVHLYASPSLEQGWETSLSLLVALVEVGALHGFEGVTVGLAPTLNLHLNHFPVGGSPQAREGAGGSSSISCSPQRATVFALLGMVCSDEHMRRAITFRTTWQRLQTYGDDAKLVRGRRANVSLARLTDALRRIAVNCPLGPNPFDKIKFMLLTSVYQWAEFDTCLRNAATRLALALPPM